MGYTRVRCLLLVLATGLRITAASTHYLADLDSCQIVGDTDLYGIGVRVGLYLQWLSLFLALVFASPNEAIHAFTASNIITLAVFTSFLVGINDHGDGLVFVDFPIVVCLTIVLSIGLVIAALFAYKDNTRTRIMACFLIFIYSCPIYMLPWVAFEGYDHGNRPHCRLQTWILWYWYDEEGAKAKKEKAKGGAHQGLQNLALFLPLLWTIILLLVFRGVFLHHHSTKSAGWSSVPGTTDDTSSSPAEATADRVQARARLPGLFIAIGTCCAIFVVAEVEQAIRENQIDMSAATWSNTGQLVPLLSGMFNSTSRENPNVAENQRLTSLGPAEN
ncbi:MAG: hypothetical protein Q9212_005976 [Teloschistes hypoglaucus]